VAHVLRKLGVQPGDRVGTLCWNSYRHLELYFGITCYGAVLHTLNLRLAHDQLAYIINHAGDSVIFVDASLVPILEQIKDELSGVKHFVIMRDVECPGTSLAPIDERTTQLTVKWVVKDPKGNDVGSLEQSNPVPIAATKGSWAGFGDIVASAAVDGVLQLLDKALSKPR